MRFDLHVHTKYSVCSNLEPSVILKRAKKLKLDGLAILDHNSMKGALGVKKLNKDKNLKIIVAEEIKTNAGHMIAYNINETITSFDINEALDKIKQQGALAVPAHPYRFLPHLKFKIPLESISRKIDAIEGLNGRVMFDSTNLRAQIKAKELSLPITGGSDAHFWYEIGDCTTIFDSSLEKALKARKTAVESRQFYGIKAFTASCMSVAIKAVRKNR
jgi:predicted metal-dependent phosphoesterase TrpH